MKNSSKLGYTAWIWATICFILLISNPVFSQTQLIMPLGDSITRGVSGPSTDDAGYRNDLADSLGSAGVSFDLVGSLADGVGFDNQHEGHDGFRADQTLANINTYLGANPDIVLLHIGTNDISNSETPQSTRDEIGQILDAIKNHNPNTKIILASLIPRTDANDGSTTTLNNLLEDLFFTKRDAGLNVFYAPMNEIFKCNPNWNTDYFDVGDHVHPNDVGYNLMARVWLNAILIALSSTDITVTDNFERSKLGVTWDFDPEFELQNGDLVNTATTGTGNWEYMAVFKGLKNPTGVSLRWSSNATATGINEGGLALLLDAGSQGASGYLAWITTADNVIRLWTITNGHTGQDLNLEQASSASPPGPGDVFEVKVSVDPANLQFDYFVNGVFAGSITAANPGLSGESYSGVILRHGRPNDIAEFSVVKSSDTTPPSAVTNLASGSVTATSVSLVWNATGDDGSTGQASSYDVRYSTGTITEANFSSAPQATGAPSPSPAGTPESFTVTGLSSGTTYFLALKAKDEAGNSSPISNVVSATTVSGNAVVDNFNRQDLGPDWTAASGYQIVNNQFENTSGLGTWDEIAIYNARKNPVEVSFTWAQAPDAQASGIDQGGFIIATSQSTTASGYAITKRNPNNEIRLWNVVDGTISGVIQKNTSPNLPPAGPGDEVKIVISSDGNGNHFDFFVNGTADGRVTDPAKTYDLSLDYWAGVVLRANLGGSDLKNALDDFSLLLEVGGPSELVIANGDAQVDTVGQTLPTALTVRTTDENGNPVQGVSINFVVTGGGGSLDVPPPSEHIVLEAEIGTLSAPMAIGADAQASSGKYIHVPDGTGGSGAGLATYSFSVDVPGDYRMLGRAITPSAQSDAFFVKIDGGQEYQWDVGQRNNQGTNWYWDEVAHRGSGSAKNPELDPVVFSLTAGIHTLAIREGKDGALLDQFVLTRDFNFAPTDTVEPGGVFTDANGEASANFTLGTSAGINTVEASFSGAPPVMFSATGVADSARNITKISGGGQSAAPGTQLPSPLVVILHDQFGNVLGAGYPVSFDVITGNGTLSTPNPIFTDANGQASNSLTTSTDTSVTEVKVTAPGYTGPDVVFVATATAGPANQLGLAQDSGDNQAGSANKPLTKPFKVLVTDMVGVPVPNHPVTFAVTGGGGSFSGSSQTTLNTGPDGVASATLTLGPTPGATNTVQVSSFLTGTSNHLNGSPLTVTATAAMAQTLEPVSQLTHNGTVNQPLAIQVQVLDSLGVELASYAVTFDVTLGDGKVNGSTNPVTVTTNSSGIAEVTWTLGPAAGVSNNKMVASATYQGQQLSGSPLEFTASAAVGSAAVLSKVSGDSLNGLIQNPLQQPFVVRVEDSSGNPVSNWPVTFAVQQGGGNFDGSSSKVVNTDANGQAAATLTLGSTAATPQNPFNNRVQVSADNNGPLTGSPITFVASAVATDARFLDLTAGGGQSGLAGGTLPQQIQIKVTDATHNNPIVSHPVSFQVSTGGGTLGSTASTDTVIVTDQNGVISVSWTLGGTLGTNSQSLTISSNDGVNPLSGSPITVLATVAAGPVDPDASFLTADVGQVPADGQSAATITVRLTDKFGNPISGKAVTLNSTGSHNFIGQPQNLTDVNGEVVGTIASTKAEVKAISARNVSDGLDLNTSVNVEFKALDPNQMQLSGGNDQTANVGTALENPIEVFVSDINNNPVSGVTVNFEISGNNGFITDVGSSSQFATRKVTAARITDANGVARANWILGTSPGTNTAQASVSLNGNPLSGSPVTFTATGVTPTPATIQEVSGNNQTWAAGLPLPQPLEVLVTDANGKPVYGETVNFTVQIGGGSLETENPVTDHQGIARTTLTLGPLVGTNQVVANHTVGSVTFTAEGVTGVPANITANSGDGGSGTVNSLYAISILITDANGNPFEGAHAAFDILEGGAALQSQDNATDAFGIADAVLMLPTSVGTVVVKATSDDLPSFFELFEVTVLPGNATDMATSGGDNQDGTTGRALAYPLEVLITDAFGNAVAGQEVTWVTQNGNSVSPGQSRSNEQGVAATVFTIVNQGANQAAAIAFGLNGSPINFIANGVTNNFPLFVGLEDMSVTEGQNLSFQVSATDDDGDPITYEAQNLPSGASFSGDTFSWTPTNEQSGDYQVTFIARDNKGGLDAETITITVQNNNNPPVITLFSPTDLNLDVLQGPTINFSITVSDADNDHLDISWLLFTSQNGNGTLVSTNSTFRFSTENFDAGSYIVKVEVSDGQDMVSVSWKIDLIVTSVELTDFAVRFDGFDGVRITWVTSREINNLGFNVLRGRSRNGAFDMINDELIESSSEGKYSYIDKKVEVGTRYFYMLEDVDVNGRKTQHGPITLDVAAPETFELTQNFPNPFNPETKIRFQLPKPERVRIRVFDVLGQEVKTLADERRTAGFHVVTWDATNNQGLKVTSGVYYYQIVAGEFRQTKKMLLLK